MRIKVYLFAWDNDAGNGCEVYTTMQARDDALRTAFRSYIDNAEIYDDGIATHDLAKMNISDVYDMLDGDDVFDDARMTWCTRIIDTSEADLA